MRQLNEIATKICQKKFGGDPKIMATTMKAELMFVRRLVGKAAANGKNQQKVFEFTLRLLPLCSELGIDPYNEPSVARGLKKSKTLGDELLDGLQGGKARGADREGKAKTKTAVVSPISTRRNPG